MTTITEAAYAGLSEGEYKRRIRAWTMYDWANSAFATTILAAVLPIYYSEVAGATLPSSAAATALWSLGLSISLFIIAIASPILGTISDIRRNKKPFLSVFLTFGILATGLLILVNTGDWVLASILFIVGRLGFTGANVFYDALLPHVAKPEDRDRVSTRGYAMGYLGGGILLAINIAMIQVWGGMWGSRISFLSVAIWWAIFSIPLFKQIPEPPTATMTLGPKDTVFSASFRRLADTFKDIRQYRELFKFLIAFLIYNDGIGTIIGVAAIYGAELGFGATELTLALLLVQFVGIPFSLIFGRIPSPKEKRRALFLAFVVYNIIMLPLVGILGLRVLPDTTTGAQLPAYASSPDAIGEGTYLADSKGLSFDPTFEALTVSAEEASGGAFFQFINRLFGEDIGNVTYMVSEDSKASLDIPFNGQEVVITHGKGPDHGRWQVEVDGVPYLDADGELVFIDGYSDVIRYGVLSDTFETSEPGTHLLRLVNSATPNPSSSGTVMSIAKVEILPPQRTSSLPTILGLILGVEAIGVLFALFFGNLLFSRLADTLTTKRSILIALITYATIAIWGYFLNSTIEFWFLAWMVAIVQGGSQALSRSLYASMSPATKSGEFFGLFGVMEKFSAILGPILFAAAGAIFASSRPAILSLIAFFIVGGILLNSVKVEDGIKVAQEEDRAVRSTAESPS
jgi:UMF1 family MFS transporter